MLAAIADPGAMASTTVGASAGFGAGVCPVDHGTAGVEVPGQRVVPAGPDPEGYGLEAARPRHPGRQQRPRRVEAVGDLEHQ